MPIFLCVDNNVQNGLSISRLALAVRQGLFVLAVGCSASAMAADYTLTGGAGGAGGVGGYGGAESAAGGDGASGGQGANSTYTGNTTANGGANGNGGAEHNGGTSGGGGTSGNGTGAGAAGSGGAAGGTNSYTDAGGGGGGAGGGGGGGAGDIASVNDAAAATITITGGKGGKGGNGGEGGTSSGTSSTPPVGSPCGVGSNNNCGGGNGGGGGGGGGGGSAGLTLSGALAVGDISLTAGRGGDGGQGGLAGLDDSISYGSSGNGAAGGSGGDGGNASLSISAVRTGAISLTAGDGGTGGAGGNASDGDGLHSGLADHGGDGGAGGHAGKGGDAVLELSASRVETGNITLSSGSGGSKGSDGNDGSGINSGVGGDGGDGGNAGQIGAVYFSAKTLVAPKLVLTRNDGGLNVSVQTLDVRTGDTALETAGTLATEVHFDTISLGQGRTFNVSGAGTTTYGFNALDVHARSSAAQIVGDIDLSGRELNFHPVPTLDEGVTMLNVSGDVDVTGAQLGGATLIGLQGGRAHRDVLSLLTAANLNGTPGNEGEVRRGVQGVSVGYEYALTTQNGANGGMALRMTSARAAPQAKVLSEGFLGGALFLSQGSTVLADSGIRLAVDSASRQTGIGVFGTVGASSMRYESGSSIDVQGVNLLAGIAADKRVELGTLTIGAFVEYGTGRYDTENDFGASGQPWSLNGRTKLKGSGDASYAGAGLLVHYKADSGYHVEASARTGQAETDFSSRDLVDYLGRRASYSTQTNYTGLHVGAGKLWKLGENDTLDLYGKYFWLRQQGSHANLPTGDDIEFEAVDFGRLRLGVRLAHKVSTAWSAYTGLAYEQEFGGEAKATTSTVAARYNIDAPDVGGASGIAEVGFSARQGKDFPVGIDLGLQGYGGKATGVIGSLRIRYSF